MPWYFSCKSHWFCGLVQIHPQDVVVFILNTATESGWLSPWDPPLPWGKVHERTYRPATYPIHFAAYFTRQNPSLRCMGGIFLLWSLVGAEAPPSCLRKTALPLKSPTGAFIAAQPRHSHFRRKQKIRTLLLLRKGSDFHGLVRWKGLEPPAYWFVVSHSIQLSYQRIRSVRNMMYFITKGGVCQQLF